MKETLQDLKTRRSCRKYKPDQISEEQLNEILEAGTYAPTGMGAQCPVIVVIQDKKTRDYVSELNAKVLGNNTDPFYGAPTVLVVLAERSRGTHVDDGNMVIANLLNAAHAVGVSVEAELGALAGIEDGESVANAKVTDPKDAAKFVELTNVDAMALSIGNAHGLYKGVPNLHYDVLEETAKLIDTPLVLHGGTGLSKEQFAKCIDLGVKKVNIGTEIKRSFMDTFTNLHLQDKEAYDFVNIPQKAKEAVANTVEQNLRFFAEGWKSELK